MKQVDLFGNEIVEVNAGLPKRRGTKTSFGDYDVFVEKFKSKKTTDDCYTPEAVYDCVLSYVTECYDLRNSEIVRPFYPGGDYESANYPEGCVVVDNPPFSIVTKIVRFYIEKNIKFFLFAPHLTLFQGARYCTAIVVGAAIVYENGAIVKTSFLTNMAGDARVIGDVELHEQLRRTLRLMGHADRVDLPAYQYPLNVLTVSMVHSLVLKKIPVQFDNEETVFVNGLECQKKYRKSIFGGGLLLSEKAAAKRTVAERAAAERIIEERAAANKTFTWTLSEREVSIIKKMC
jgi:hypothetical protein